MVASMVASLAVLLEFEKVALSVVLMVIMLAFLTDGEKVHSMADNMATNQNKKYPQQLKSRCNKFLLLTSVEPF